MSCTVKNRKNRSRNDLTHRIAIILGGFFRFFLTDMYIGVLDTLSFNSIICFYNSYLFFFVSFLLPPIMLCSVNPTQLLDFYTKITTKTSQI